MMLLSAIRRAGDRPARVHRVITTKRGSLLGLTAVIPKLYLVHNVVHVTNVFSKIEGQTEKFLEICQPIQSSRNRKTKTQHEKQATVDLMSRELRARRNPGQTGGYLKPLLGRWVRRGNARRAAADVMSLGLRRETGE